MDCDVFDEDASELSIISKDWMQLQNSRFKAGYVVGSTAGQEANSQQGFDHGFKVGFFSSFLLSQIRGILKALLSYRALYEGHPITDDVVLDAHQLLDDLSQLEADSVAEDFLKMQLTNGAVQMNDGIDPDEFSKLSMDVDSSEKPQDCGSSSFEMPRNSSLLEEQHATMLAHLTLDDVNRSLLTCPEIADVIRKCKCILKRLRWTDSMIDQIF